MRINFPTFVHELETAVAESRTLEYEAHNGPTDIVLVRIVPYKRNAGLSQGVTVIFISVNFQSEIVEKIGNQQLESFERLLDSMPWPGFIKSGDGIYQYTNESMNQFAARNLVGAKDDAWLNPDMAQFFGAQDSSVLEGSLAATEHFKAIEQGNSAFAPSAPGATAGSEESNTQGQVTYTRNVFKLETVKSGLENAVAGVILKDH